MSALPAVIKAVPPVLAYCSASMAMIFTNKFILSQSTGYGFKHVNMLMVAQAVIAAICIKLLSLFQLIKLESLNWKTAKKWAPVTLGFAAMLYTGSKTLTYLTIAVITVFKNTTNLLIAYGDWHFFDQHVSVGILSSFMIMLLGSVMTGLTDLHFNLVGYLWMAGNCCSQAGYVLYMRQAKKDTNLSQWGMSYYNNIIGIAVFLPAALFTGELVDCWSDPLIEDPLFLGAVVFSGVIGTCLSLSVFWVVGATSPTTYSMIGSINKIPITFLSVLLFHSTLTVKSGVSICIGLASGVIYTLAKLYDADKLPFGKPPPAHPVRKV